MKVIICGGGGFIGQHLARHLLGKGYEVVILDRNQSGVTSPKLQSFVVNLLDTGLFEKRWFMETDAIINLSGKDILTLWTEEYKKAIWESRITVNKKLIDFVSALEQKPRTFVSASAVGFYGNKGENEVDETASHGKGFLADVCIAWENEARRAETLGIRSVQLRTAPVLDRWGGFLGKLVKSMRFGFTLQFGSGQNWFPWIHMDDLIHIYETAIADERLSGPVNACSPQPVRFRELLDHLRIYHKAIVIPFPVALVRPFIKDLANELTNSQKVIPAKLNNIQFKFDYGNLKKALEAVFSQS
jgi:uncharacterized protein (TIGR01777 family)